MGEPVADEIGDSLPDEILLLVIHRVAEQDPASLVAANVASAAVSKLAPPQSPLWNNAFYKQLQALPPCDSPEARALEEEIQGFGGYKGLIAAVKGGSDRSSSTSLSLNKHEGNPGDLASVGVIETSFLYLIRTVDGRLIFWGGGTEGESSQRGALLADKSETRFTVSAEPHPLVRDAEILALMEGKRWEPYLMRAVTFVYKKSTVKLAASGQQGARLRVWSVPLSLHVYLRGILECHPLPGRDPNLETHHNCLSCPDRHRSELCLCKKMDYGVSLGSKHENVSCCTIEGRVDLNEDAFCLVGHAKL